MDDIRSRTEAGGITFIETTSPKYHDRTVINAREADATVAFAMDFGTPGERLTRTAAGERYIPVRLPESPEGFRDEDMVSSAATYLSHRLEGQGPLNINMAGNAMETLSRKGVSQDDADAFVADVLGRAMAMGLRVSGIRSGGQSGIDEAGTKAAVSYGLPSFVVCPRGFLYNGSDGSPHWNRDAFIGRFGDIPQRQVPEKVFDVRTAFSGSEKSPEALRYRPSLDSPMPGAVAADIIAAPYLHADASGEGFELFAPTRSGYGERAVSSHPSPTSNTVLSLAVMDWLAGDPSHEEAELRHRIQTMGPDHITSNNAAVAASMAGIAASGVTEARDLARTVVRAFGKDPSEDVSAEALAVAVFMASRGRSREDIAFCMAHDYGVDTNLASAGIHARRLMDEGKDDRTVSMVMLQEHGISVGREHSEDAAGNIVYALDDILPRTRVMEEHSAEVNGETYSWMEPSSRRDTLSEHALPLALASFMESRSFEDSVRKAVAVGGDSPAIAAMSGALAAAYYGGVPEAMASRCSLYLGTSQNETMTRFLGMGEAVEFDGKKNALPHIDVHVFHGEPFAAVRHSDKALLSAAEAEGINVVPARELREMMEEAGEGERRTHLDGHYRGMQRLYLTSDGLKDVSSVDAPGFPSREDRQRSRLIFDELERWCRDIRVTLERRSGIADPRSEMLGGMFRFTTAYYPRVLADRIEVREGDLLAGAVCIDQNTGLLKVQWAGDYRDGEYREADWCREHVFDPSRIITKSTHEYDLPDSVRRDLKSEGLEFGREELVSMNRMARSSSSYTEDLDGIKAAIARFCLDEGLGIDGMDRESNIERANRDVVALAVELSGRLSASDDDVSMYRRHGEELENALSQYCEGYRVIVRDGLSNLQDRDGGFLLRSWYPEVTPFAEGFARVRTEDGLWNYVGHDGTALLHHGVGKAQAFSEGLAAVMKDGRWNYIGKDGVTIGRRWFEDAGPFVDGKATVRLDGRETRIDREGNLLQSREHKGVRV